MNAKWWFVIVLVLILVGVGGYQVIPVEREVGTVTVCSDPHHEGEKTLSDLTSTTYVPRWKAEQYKVETKSVVCDACRTRNDREQREAEERAERERREAERQAKIKEVKNSIVAKLGLCGNPTVGATNGIVVTIDAPYDQEISAKPGDRVRLTFCVCNSGSEPISGLKVLIAPTDDFKLVLPGEDMAPTFAGYRPDDKVIKWQGAKRRGYRLITTTGLPIGELKPACSKYYNFVRFCWPINSAESFDEGHFTYLKKNARPGTDIQVTGYVIFQGEKLKFNTVTIHVMFP